VVDQPEKPRVLVPVPEKDQDELKSIYQFCQNHRMEIWHDQGEWIETWWDQISESRRDALIRFETLPHPLSPSEISLSSFISWRKFHPEIKTLDIRESMQKNKEWKEFISTHLSIFEFITDPRMNNEFFEKGILYMIYVKKMVENDMYKDANEAKKLISERLVALFQRPDIRVVKKHMDQFMAQRYKEDELHKRKIQQRLI